MNITDKLAQALRALTTSIRFTPLGLGAMKNLTSADIVLAEYDAQQTSYMGTPGERAPLVAFIKRNWLNSVAEDGDAAVLTLVRDGWRGTNHMTLAELRKEAEDAGYGAED